MDLGQRQRLEPKSDLRDPRIEHGDHVAEIVVAWYAGIGPAALVLVLTIAAVAFTVSVGGRRMFGGQMYVAHVSFGGVALIAVREPTMR